MENRAAKTRWICVNPHHLEPVTHEENVRRGKARTKLFREDVVKMFEIRAGGMTVKSIGDRFDISHSHACKILRGKKWKGVVSLTGTK